MKKKFKHGLINMKGSPVHKGHKYLFKQAAKVCIFLTVVIASAQEENTDRIPFTLGERVRMVENCLKKLGIKNFKIVTINDLGPNGVWSDYVFEHVSKYRDIPIDAYFAGDEYNAKFFRDQEGLEVFVMDRVESCEKYDLKSGTEIRQMIFDGNKDWVKYVPKENWRIVRRLVKPNML